MKKWILAALCGCLFTGGLAETTNTVDTAKIVVSATRTPVALSEIGSSMSVATGAEAERYQLRTVVQAVDTTPGISFNQSGGAGQQSSLYIRGSKAEHVKIYIDGISVSDSSNPTRYPDLSHLTMDNIERIEILRGPQSTLYGSDAIGGVINIITKRGAGHPGFSLDLEGGSFDTIRTAAGSSGGNKFINYSASVSHYETGGISAAKGDEEDGYRNTTIHSRIGITPVDFAGIDFIFRHVDTEGDYDDATGDALHRFDTDQTYFRTEGNLALFDDIWDQKLGVSLTQNDRDLVHELFGASWFDGNTVQADYQSSLYLNDMNTLTAGTEWGHEDYEDAFGGKYNIDRAAIYAQEEFSLMETFFATAGIRYEDHQQAGDETTYRLTSAYLIDETRTKLKASWGTGFRVPSLYQLYAPFGMGNSALAPEKSSGWDIGFEQGIVSNKLNMGATWFQNNLENTISWDPGSFTYVQSSDVETKGAELFFDASPVEPLTLNINYTYLLVNDKDPAGFYERRKPKHEVNARADLQLTEKLNVYVSGTYASDRPDGTGVTLDEYILFNTGAGFQVTSNLLIYARIENLTDVDYELVDGYETAGISGYAGAKFKF